MGGLQTLGDLAAKPQRGPALMLVIFGEPRLAYASVAELFEDLAAADLLADHDGTILPPQPYLSGTGLQSNYPLGPSCGADREAQQDLRVFRFCRRLFNASRRDPCRLEVSSRILFRQVMQLRALAR